MEVALEEEMKVLLQHETEKLRKKLSGAHADDPLFICKDLAGKDPVQILVSILILTISTLGERSCSDTSQHF